MDHHHSRKVLPFRGRPALKTQGTPKVEPEAQGWVGSKCDRSRDIKDTAKLVRRDIKRAIKAAELPKLKCSVRISRYSGGQSLGVTVKEVHGVLVYNPTFARWVMSDDRFSHDRPQDAYTDVGDEILQKLRDIVAAYNFDFSDTITDLFRVGFYSSVEFSRDLQQRQCRFASAIDPSLRVTARHWRDHLS